MRLTAAINGACSPAMIAACAVILSLRPLNCPRSSGEVTTAPLTGLVESKAISFGELSCPRLRSRRRGRRGFIRRLRVFQILLRAIEVALVNFAGVGERQP